MKNYSVRFIKIFSFILLMLAVSCLAVACSPQNKTCKVNVVGMYQGHQLYSMQVKYKEFEQKTVEPMDVIGYEFESFEGAPNSTQISLTYDLNKKTIKVLYQPKFLNLPVIWIETLGNGQITSKENYTSCGVRAQRDNLGF